MNSFTGRDVRILDILISKYISREIKDYGLGPGNYNLLMLIFEQQGITMEKAAMILRIDKAAVSRMVKRLAEMEYIVKESDINDRRVYRLYCTDNGKNASVHMRKIRKKINGILIVGMDESEIMIFNRQMEVMKRNLRILLGEEEST